MVIYVARRLDILLVVGSFTVVLNLVADVLYAVVDPRIRY